MLNFGASKPRVKGGPGPWAPLDLHLWVGGGGSMMSLPIWSHILSRGSASRGDGLPQGEDTLEGHSRRTFSTRRP